MNVSKRLKRIEAVTAPTLSKAKQEELLEAYIQVETAFRGQPPTAAEIEDERVKLSRPSRQLTKKGFDAVVKEVEVLFAAAAKDK